MIRLLNLWVNLETKEVTIFTSQNHSTVAFVRYSGERFPADCFFHFTITQRTPLLQQPSYSDYQYFLYETISELKDKQMTFNQIAEELNRKGYIEIVQGESFGEVYFKSSEEVVH